MIAWLVEAPGPKWVAFDEVSGELFLTEIADEAIRYGSEETASAAALLFTDSDSTGYVAPQLIATEHEWPEVSP